VISPEATRIRAAWFPSRTVPDYSVTELREHEFMARKHDLLPAGVGVRSNRIAGFECEWINEDAGQSTRTILYLHGGGYVSGGCATHRNLVSRLARAAGARALVPEYRLAPESPFPAAVQDASDIYEALLSDEVGPSGLAIMGDSSGGGLCAALMLLLRDQGRPLPAAGVLISPWTDLTLSGKSYLTRADLDPLDRWPVVHRLANLYVPSGALTAPLASPMFGDLRGFPPLFIQVGDHEVLLDDSLSFASKAQASDVDVELDVWPEMWHDWQMAAPAMPEANEAIDRIGCYVRQRVP